MFPSASVKESCALKIFSEYYFFNFSFAYCEPNKTLWCKCSFCFGHCRCYINISWMNYYLHWMEGLSMINILVISDVNTTTTNPIFLNFAPTYSQFHPAPPSPFQPPHSSQQHPERYKNQNIARNWAISSNLGRKSQSYPIYMKLGTHILGEMIPNPDLEFWNSIL